MDKCWFCKAEIIMREFQRQLDELGELGAEIYDNPITKIYNMADDCLPVYQCYCKGADDE